MLAIYPLLLVSVMAGASEDPVVIYDLRPTLKLDLKDPVQTAQAWDECHAVATLQGIVNRRAPRLYLLYVKGFGIETDEYWWQRMAEPGGWLAGRRTRPIQDLAELVRHFRRDIRGVVVYDGRVAATSNLASTVAGAEDLIAVRFDPHPQSVYARLVRGGPRLPVKVRLMAEDGGPLFTGKGTIPGTELPSTGSVKGDAYLWLKHHYLDAGKVDPCYAGYYLDAYWLTRPRVDAPNHHTLTNHDFFVARRGWFFDLNVWMDEVPVDDPEQPPGTDGRILRELLLSAYKGGGRDRMIHIGGFTPWFLKYTTHPGSGGRRGDVETEWETVRVCGYYNAFIDADAFGLGAMANASFYMHYPLKPSYPQKWVTREELRRRGYLNADGTVRFDGRDFVILYVGDYDAAAWIYQAMPALWDHPDRGKLPLMWCLTPVAERRVPMILDYTRRTATPNDYFAAADNGAGYLNPGTLQEPRELSGLPCGLEAWARHCRPLYERWGLTVTGFIIDGFAPGLNSGGLDCYASFSPNGIVPQKVPATLLHGRMPVLRASYDLGGSPAESARVIKKAVDDRPIPFHHFRAILQHPGWYLELREEIRRLDPKIEWLDAPSFFELYRAYLETTPDAAAGAIDSPR